MDVGPLEGGHSDLGMDLPPSPEDQISAGSHEDQSFDDKSDFGMDNSPSPQSQYSFSINSISLPEDEGHLGGSGGYFPNLDVMLGKEAKPHPGPRQFDIVDVPQPTGPCEHFGRLLEAQKKIGMDFPQPTEAEQPTGEALTACKVWKWGEPAPSSFAMGMQELSESATTPGHQEAHDDTPEPVRHITFWQQDDGITPMFRSILLLHDEMKRLCHVENQLIDIYERDLDLLMVMNQMVDSLDDADMQNIVCLIGQTLRTMPVRDMNKNGHNVPSEHISSSLCHNGFTAVFTASLMLRDKMRRLHHIDNEERQLYDAGLNLIVAVNRIVTMSIMKENSAWPDRGHQQWVEANYQSMGQHTNFGSFIDW
ncbi:hypothetical protein EI94DRAFT_1706259 [Lactarius quietus]|nr:hypothetical protein EI94DRAFT_1706259 [Lactarius quietus]